MICLNSRNATNTKLPGGIKYKINCYLVSPIPALLLKVSCN